MSNVSTHIFQVINEYNENQRAYNQNMRSLLNIIDDLNQERINQQQRRVQPPETRGVDMGARVGLAGLRGERPNILSRQIEDRILFYLNPLLVSSTEPQTHTPTPEQIERAVEYYTYNVPVVEGDADTAAAATAAATEPDICPISMDAFQEGMEITRIRYCGHKFRRECLEQWFISHDVCPVCRHNINATMVADVSATPVTVPPTHAAAPTAEPRFRQSSSRSIRSNFLTQLLGMLDISGATAAASTAENNNTINLLYEFDIPLSYTGGGDDYSVFDLQPPVD
jgi:hypothetical protein